MGVRGEAETHLPEPVFSSDLGESDGGPGMIMQHGEGCRLNPIETGGDGGEHV